MALEVGLARYTVFLVKQNISRHTKFIQVLGCGCGSLGGSGSILGQKVISAPENARRLCVDLFPIKQQVIRQGLSTLQLDAKDSESLAI